MGKFVIKKVATGIKFDLKAGNGEVIATSEVYTTEDACRGGIASVAKNAPQQALKTRPLQKSKHSNTPNLNSMKIKLANSASA